MQRRNKVSSFLQQNFNFLEKVIAWNFHNNCLNFFGPYTSTTRGTQCSAVYNKKKSVITLQNLLLCIFPFGPESRFKIGAPSKH